MYRLNYWFTLLLALALVFAPLPALAQGGDRYQDPAGRFSVPVPVGWTDESTDDYACFISPDGAVHYWVMAVEAADVQEGVAAALEIVAPGFAGSPVQSMQVPLLDGLWLQNFYTLESGDLIVILAQARVGTVYLAAERGEQRALQAVNNTVVASITGLEIAAAPEPIPSYRDPAGRFSAPAPSGWSDASTADYGHFTSADPAADLYLLAVEAEDVDTGIAAALQVILPGFAQQPAQSSDVPAPNGIWRQNIYVLENGELLVALGQQQANVTYAVIIRAAQSALSALTPILNNVLLGVAITATGEVIDLSAAEPLAFADVQAEFAAYVEDVLARYAVPGAAVAVVQGGEIVYAGGFGVTALGSDDPVTPETLFGVGSVTKAVNATFMATLVDAGLLDWDQPVIEILPTFRVSDADLTQTLRVRDLLGNSSGLERADLVWLGTNSTAEQIIASLADLPFVARPGQRFGYNNQMVSAGGYLGALAAGGAWGRLDEAYVQAVEERVLGPVGMETATFSITEAQAAPSVALPHDITLAGQVFPTVYQDFSGVLPAGGLNAGALDLARFLIMQLNAGVAADGTRVVSAEALAQTWQPQIEIAADMVERTLFPPGERVEYGMGWFVQDFNGLRLLSHAGDTEGFSSLIAFAPDADLGIVVLNNKIGASSFNAAVEYRLLELLYGLEPTMDAFYEAQRAQAERALAAFAGNLSTLDVEAVTPYLGRYSDNTALELRDGELWMTRGNYAWRLVPGQEEGSYVFYNGLFLARTLTFAEDDAGGVSLLLEGVLELAHSVD
jgi:CubicO group peptidase (beta-lactamase class C family)